MGEERTHAGLFVGLAAAAAAALILATWLRPEEPPPPEPAPLAFAPAPAPEPEPVPAPPPSTKPRRDPAGAAKHFERGCELYAEERHEEAQAEFELALELNPKIEAARFNLALVYYRYGRYVEAEKLLEEIIKANPWYARAQTLLEEVRTEHAQMRHAPGGGDL